MKNNLYNYDMQCNLTGVDIKDFEKIVDCINLSGLYKKINIDEMYECDFKNIYTLKKYLEER